MSRGTKNNNPLNLRHSADQWQGARKEQTDKSFVQFESMAYGYRAAWKTLDSYWKHFKRLRQPFTVRAIISRWAPPSENNTDAYVTTVLRLTSLGGNERLPRPLRGIAIDKLVRLFRAMTTVECGTPYDQVSEEPIWDGYDLAFPGKRKQRCHSSPPIRRTHPPSASRPNWARRHPSHVLPTMSTGTGHRKPTACDVRRV